MTPLKLLCGLTLAAAVPLAATAGGALEVRTEGGVSYVSGGVSEAERRELEAAAGGFNLRVAVRSDDGPYLGPSSIRIERESGEKVLAATTRGPIFLARLPPGTYLVHAEESGQSGAEEVEIDDGELAEVRFLFRWEGEEHGR